MTIDFKALAAPFEPSQVSWRVGSTTGDKKKAMALAYIDARDVQARLDAVCGPGNWQCRYPHAAVKTVCEIGIKVGDEWVWKADGAGDSDIEAVKGSLSDAFKRAAVRWGVGRYLYDVESPWVEIEPAGRSFKIAAHELQRLRGTLAGFAASKPSSPAQPTPRQLAAKPSPSAWATEAIRAIGATQSQDELGCWEKVNGKAVLALRGKDADAHARVVTAIQEQGERLG